MTIISGLAAQYTKVSPKLAGKFSNNILKIICFVFFLAVSYKIGAYKRCLKQLQYKSLLLLIGHPNILR